MYGCDGFNCTFNTDSVLNVRMICTNIIATSSNQPSHNPTVIPSEAPSKTQSLSNGPSSNLIDSPSATGSPGTTFSNQPSHNPIVIPSEAPSKTLSPSNGPGSNPSDSPSSTKQQSKCNSFQST